jgi:hypothetical protein
MSKSLTVNPTKWNWTDPAQPAGDNVTGYIIGVRDLNAAGSSPGTYPAQVPVSGAAATSEDFSVAMQALNLPVPGDYQSAIRTVTSNAGQSPWSAEVLATSAGTGTDFSLVPPTPVAPVGFTVA